MKSKGSLACREGHFKEGREREEMIGVRRVASRLSGRRICLAHDTQHVDHHPWTSPPHRRESELQRPNMGMNQRLQQLQSPTVLRGALHCLCPWWSSHHLVSSARDESLREEKQEQEQEQQQQKEEEDRKAALLRQYLVRLKKRERDIDDNWSLPLVDLVSHCKQESRVSDEEAQEMVRRMEEAGLLLTFRNKAILNPHKVSEALAKAIPLPLALNNVADDPRGLEFQRLQKEKDEIDAIARRQVHRILYVGLALISFQFIFFFRLTFWDLSWDVIEPIMFFLTCAGITASFLFFLVTSRDPSFRGLLHTLFLSKQRKLMRRRNFDLQRYKELQLQCCCQSHPHNDQHDLM